MRRRTAVDTKAGNELAMGATLGAIYSELWQELARLHRKWDEYVQLFGTSEERVALLNRAAPVTFRIMQDALWDDVLMGIARLTDRALVAGKQTLSLETLAENVDRPKAKKPLEGCIKDCESSCEFARDHRNRRLSHNDYLLALQQGATPLKPQSRESLRRALSDLVAALNVVAKEYLDSTSRFDIWRGGAAVSLLLVLRDGVETQRARQARFESATPTPEDIAASIRPI